MSIISDEGQMRAARVMSDAADENRRTTDRIEEAIRQMQMIFDPGYCGVAPRLLEKLEETLKSHDVNNQGQLEPERSKDTPLVAQLAEAVAQIKAMRTCGNCKHDRGGFVCKSKKKCYDSSTDTVSLDGWEMKARGK